MTRIRVVAVVLGIGAAASLLPACSIGGGGDDSYQLTAEFSRAVGLYPHGDVFVMGLAVGTVDDVVIEDTIVRVEMSIRKDVPLPEDVQATIEAQTLIGERHVTLFPPWDASMAEAGQGRAEDGDVIPVDRTVIPVEPDEALEAFNDLARSLEADVIGGFVSDSARALEGQGEAIGEALDAGASLSTTLAGLDEQLLAVAEHLHTVAGSLSSRDAQLEALITSFGEATGVLAAEREGIATFLGALVDLTEQGQSLLDLHGEQLPGDIADLAALASVLDENSAATEELLSAFPAVAEGLQRAYQPEINGFFLRASSSATLTAFADEFVRLLRLLGIVP